jgi:imidazolonepropionase-like amidohydrolase
MMRRLSIVTFLAAALFAVQQPAAQQTGSVVFTDVSVVPMDSNRVLENQTVVVTKDRITAVGPAGKAQVPAGAIQVDGKGKYLMPGLAEMHGHVPQPKESTQFLEDVLFLYVAAGVTTVRGMQGAPGQLEMREAVRRGDMAGPNLYLAGPGFSGGGGNPVKTVDEAEARVRQQKKDGWDLLKVLPGLTRDVYDAMARTAKEVDIPFAGHVPEAVGVPHALEMGQDTIDHLDGYAEHLGGQTKPVDDKGIQDLVERTRKAGTWMVPTLVVWETLRGPVTLESRKAMPGLQYLPRPMVEQWTKAVENRLKSPKYDPEHARIYIDNRMRIMTALYKGGVGILLGSDAPQQFNTPGFSIYPEMKRMADAGMTTFDVIKSGTASVGEYYKERAKDAFGTVAVGQRADLILVDANPLQNLANIENRSGVMIRGRWLPQSEIDARLKKIEARAAAAPPATN